MMMIPRSSNLSCPNNAHSKFDDAVQAYAAGFVEGVLTQQRIYEQSLNMNYE